MIIIIFFLIVWLIILQNKYSYLTEKIERLQIQLNNYKNQLESLEYDFQSTYFEIKRQISNNKHNQSAENTGIKNKTTEQIKESKEQKESIEQTEQNIVTKIQNKQEITESIKEDSPLEESPIPEIKNQNKKIVNFVNTIHSDEKIINKEPNINNIQDSSVLEEKTDLAINKDKDVNEIAPTKAKEPISFVQLFSWIGGFILLLGVVFWVKYALENGLIPNWLRLTLGTLAGISLWGSGIYLRKPSVKTTSDTLCACGLTTLYSVWYAAYYFEIISSGTSFVILTLVAFASFGTAVWKNAQYIGVLAQIIGFLTPALLNNNSQIWFLLIYIGLINIAAVSAALKKNWSNQLYTGLIFTFISFISVISNGNIVQLTIFPSVFAVLYTIIAVNLDNKLLLRLSFIFTSIALVVLGIQAFTIEIKSLPYLITFAGFFAICFGIIAYKKQNKELFYCSVAFTLVSFILIAVAKSFFSLFIFIVVLSAFFSYLSTKLKDGNLQTLSLVLSSLGFVVLFISDGFSVINPSYLPYISCFTVFFNLFFGFVAYKQKDSKLLQNTIFVSLFAFCFLYYFKDEKYLIPIVALFTFFFGTLSSKMKDVSLQNNSVIYTSISNILICFLCLDKKLHIHPFMAITLIENVFYYYLSIKNKAESIYSYSAFSTFLNIIIIYILSEYSYNDLLGWLIIYNIITMLVPFIFIKLFENSKIAWAVLSFINIVAGLFIVNMISPHANWVTKGYFCFLMSIIYAIYTYQVTTLYKLEENIQKLRISLLCNAPIILSIIFISLVAEKEIKTILFCIEAIGLIWLWCKLKVELIQNYGFILLTVAASRLLLNPFIIDYYEKTMIIFNWYLYTYIIAAISMFIGAYLWRKEESRLIPNTLNIIGGILLFALVNIEIANYYCNGIGLKFNFFGEFSEAATYTIAWAICGAICMFSANKKVPYLLHTGICLIVLVLLKIFLSDIWKLSSGLRIAVLIFVAVIMLAISFIYQLTPKKTNSK